MQTVMYCDKQAQRWIASLPSVLLISLSFLLTGCEDGPGAFPPSSFDDIATHTADSEEDEGSGSSVMTGLTDVGDFDFSTDPLPDAQALYFMNGDELWTLDAGGDPEPVADDLTIAGYSASAEGDRVAVLHMERDSGGDEHGVVSILSASGEVLFDLSELDEGFNVSQISPIQTLSMRPDGDSLVVTHQNGAMTLVMLDGDVRQLLPPSIEQQPGRITWSADGQFLAYLDPWMPNEPSSLFITVPGREIRLSLMEASGDDDGIIRARWIPGTNRIAVIRSTGSTISHGGDLFLIDVENGQRELVMSSGAIAPVAGLVDLEPSPDGSWLAATGFVPGVEFPRFGGLWMINVQSGVSTEIDLENAAAVTDLWWIDGALVVRVIDEPQTSLPGAYTGRESFRLVEIDPRDGETTELYVANKGSSDD
jgi:hypothetical protein